GVVIGAGRIRGLAAAQALERGEHLPVPAGDVNEDLPRAPGAEPDPAQVAVAEAAPTLEQLGIGLVRVLEQLPLVRHTSSPGSPEPSLLSPGKTPADARRETARQEKRRV